ncbi:MAG: EAL domain-containing protein [Actinomycetota bacterium]|nr:EAL domain-containing protein [Actinomycetota bacterium]
MAHEDSLSSVLTDFARNLGTDLPIQGILDRLVERIVDVLPISGAGVALISPGNAPQYVAASSESALQFERLQIELGQGPCLTTYESGRPVLIPDLADEGRYPEFGPRAMSVGMAAVFTFPLGHADSRLGTLDLYRDIPGELCVKDMEAAQTLADVATAYLLHARAREHALEISERFRASGLHDALTGLPNRVLLQQRLEHAARRARRSRGKVAVLFANLDRFKRVNDSYGHSVGDDLLIAVAHRLSAVVRPGDTLARVSGDEFVFLCEDLADVNDVEFLASRIERAFATPFVLTGAEVFVTASVGISYAGPGEAVSSQLVINADIAMNEAKRRGGAAHQLIDARAANEAHERNHLEQDLRKAFPGAEVDLAYQPIVRTADGLVTGVEALLRWTHPDQGVVSALTAVQIGEQNGLIAEIGAWVLQRACRDRIQWLADCPQLPLDLSVNVSARQLMDRRFCAIVADVLATTGMDPACLVLEVTEGIFIDDDLRAMKVLAELKTQGVRLALDDFGTGYCSLGYLQRFPVDMVKIDRGFVANLKRDPTAAAIVAAVTNLAHVLGISVTAEGVETQQQHEEIVSIGCDFGQGFFYARPMSCLEVSTTLMSSPSGPLHLPTSTTPHRAGPIDSLLA